jgi:hypothetical protein
MHHNNEAWVEHQRKRWMKPNVYLYVQSDQNRWRGPQACECKYRPDQARDDHGKWTEEFDKSHVESETSDNIDLGAQFAANGHHYIPQGVVGKEKYSFSSETLEVLKGAKTGPLQDPTSNRFDDWHRQYNKAVEENLDRFLTDKGIRGDQMTPDQARQFIDQVKTSRDPRISRFNIRLWMRELNYWVRRGGRGRE